MNLKNQSPIWVPEQFQDEIEKLSKAALMDMVWDLAARACGHDGGHPQAQAAIMQEVRKTAHITLTHRKQAKAGL